MTTFTKSLFAVELDGQPFAVALPSDKMNELLAVAASMSSGGALELMPVSNKDLFAMVMVPTVTQTAVRSIVKSLSDMTLAACAQEVIGRQDTETLPDGALRALAVRLKAEAGIDEMSSLAQAEAAVLREATLRFIVASIIK